MYSLEDSFRTGMAMFWAILFTTTCESYRPVIEFELKKELNRKLTDDEWLYLIHESYKKIQVDRQQEQFKKWIQRQADRKTIHDFVWNTHRR